MAAGQQAGAAQNATNAQLGMFNQVMSNLQPYQQAGAGALGALNYGLGIGGGPGNARPTTGGGAPDAQGGAAPGSYGWLTHPFGAADLNANLAPNYQFQLGQGLGQIQNQNAAAGGALSGNSLAGLNTFAQNYSQNAYQQAFQNYTANQQSIGARLGNLAQLGENASTGSASGAPQFSQGISQTIQGLGAANAAGTVGTANALSGGLNNAYGYYQLNQLLNPPTPGSQPGGAQSVY
jgi:hypothetical protein